ncbi:alpha/beta fold hydrolase [Streptomyces hyaluromycini]|uniref:Alpha/beta fold hydrolase n=1 Tax=Streptomyces hyaluromycini TaxID=1377993 RepID=A0ABV1XBD0_9ACTN
MPYARIDGRDLAYEEYGAAGAPAVVLVAGTGAPGRVWRAHQVPALRRAGHRVVTFDNRGLGPEPAAPGSFTLADLAADVAGLIEHLGAAPCRLVGHSLGAIIVQEVVLARPELVDRAVLMAGGGRADALIAAASAADLALADGGVRLPPAVAAHRHALQNLSPRTLDDDVRLADWLSLFELTLPDPVAVRAQLGLELIPNRLTAYRRITRPCLAVAFADDVVVRPRLTRELADAIPGCRYTEIPGCGHFGYLERPEEVNAELVGHLAGTRV